MKISVISGGFDPVHSGHIDLINHASSMGDILIVGLNSDEWLRRKKGKAFMNYEERRKILESMKNVDRVLSFNDRDGTAIALLELVKLTYLNNHIQFCNGGDRTEENIREMEIENVEFIFNVGGDKSQSSSELFPHIIISYQNVPQES